jgi:hypothetical protein
MPCLASVALMQRHRVADLAAGTQQDEFATSLLLLRSSKTGSGSLDVLPLLRQRQEQTSSFDEQSAYSSSQQHLAGRGQVVNVSSHVLDNSAQPSLRAAARATPLQPICVNWMALQSPKHWPWRQQRARSPGPSAHTALCQLLLARSAAHWPSRCQHGGITSCFSCFTLAAGGARKRWGCDSPSQWSSRGRCTTQRPTERATAGAVWMISCMAKQAYAHIPGMG